MTSPDSWRRKCNGGTLSMGIFCSVSGTEAQTGILCLTVSVSADRTSSTEAKGREKEAHSGRSELLEEAHSGRSELLEEAHSGRSELFKEAHSGRSELFLCERSHITGQRPLTRICLW